MRRAIQAAISKGVPTFNAGDHAGCAAIYRACAEQLVRSGASGDARAVLATAVTESQRGDATSAAWALREALDWCLASGSGSGSGSAQDATRAATIISEAISLGVPLFNGGEHGACADVYADAATRLSRLELPASERQALTTAANARGSPTDRAWALRRALDGCLEAVKTGGARGQAGAGAPGTVLDFTQAAAAAEWAVVNDSVMGGVSRSQLTYARTGSGAAHLMFSGELSFARNGGFASIRGPLPRGSCSGATGVVLTVRGSALPFKFSLRDSGGWNSASWQADFTPTAEWGEIRLPFAAFWPSFRGQVVGERGALRPEELMGAGFMLSKLSDDGRPNAVPEGPFQLDVRSVNTYV